MNRPAAMILILAITHAAWAGGNDSDVLQILAKVAFMGQGASEELNAIATNQTVAESLRVAAKDALQDHDRAGTNSFQTLDLFIRGWAISNEPPLNINTIDLMKRSMELGHSAEKQLGAFSTDTNRPTVFRDTAARVLTGLQNTARKAPNQASQTTPLRSESER